MVKVQGPHARNGCFTKDRFVIDLAAGVVTCPNNVTVALRPLNDGGGHASFGKACSGCPLRTRCTTARDGRVISVSVHEALLQEARRTQADPSWQADYNATRPKVSASRPIACAVATAGGGRASAARSGWTRTSSSSQRQATLPGSRSWVSPAPPEDGQQPRSDGREAKMMPIRRL
jgi:hypothetical protein